jgi:hypothetical protein
MRVCFIRVDGHVAVFGVQHACCCDYLAIHSNLCFWCEGVGLGAKHPFPSSVLYEGRQCAQAVAHDPDKVLCLDLHMCHRLSPPTEVYLNGMTQWPKTCTIGDLMVMIVLLVMMVVVAGQGGDKDPS